MHCEAAGIGMHSQASAGTVAWWSVFRDENGDWRLASWQADGTMLQDCAITSPGPWHTCFQNGVAILYGPSGLHDCAQYMEDHASHASSAYPKTPSTVMSVPKQTMVPKHPHPPAKPSGKGKGRCGRGIPISKTKPPTSVKAKGTTKPAAKKEGLLDMILDDVRLY